MAKTGFADHFRRGTLTGVAALFAIPVALFLVPAALVGVAAVYLPGWFLHGHVVRSVMNGVHRLIERSPVVRAVYPYAQQPAGTVSVAQEAGSPFLGGGTERRPSSLDERG